MTVNIGLIGTGVRESNQNLNRLLDREPTDVARDFAKNLEFLEYRNRFDV